MGRRSADVTRKFLDNSIADGAGNIPLVGVGDVLALLHRHRDAVRVANRLDRFGDAGVVEGGGGGAMEGVGIGLPLANHPVEDIGGSAKSLSVNRNALLDLDGVGGGDALRDVALLRGLG